MLLLLLETLVVFGFQKVHEGWAALGQDFDLIAVLPFVLKYFRLYQLFRLIAAITDTASDTFAATAFNPQTIEKR